MDSESDRSRKLQCWDGPAIVSSFVTQWAASQGDPVFEPDDNYCDALINIGFNECSANVRDYWRSTIKSTYRGEDGRRRIRMAAINLAERGGLHLRLSDVRCPVRWLHVSDFVRCYTFVAMLTSSNSRAPRMRCTRSPMRRKRSRCS
jgi:hypothetical protein